jgi:UDP-N-acetylglucosamine transferase subunit ALG13
MTAMAREREPASPRVVVTVGTDHHPFDRLIGWTNDWLRQHPEHIPGFFMQSGAASVQPDCPGSRFLDAGQLGALLDMADVMLCHGGPGSISDAWERGQVPIVVPRLRRLGEVVDDHQVDFCRKLAELGRVRLAEEPAGLAELLDEAARDHTRFRTTAPEADVSAAVGRFGDLVDELVSRPRHRLSLTHRARRISRRPAAGTGATAVAGHISPGLVPAASANWHHPGPSARVGLAGMANEEQE